MPQADPPLAENFSVNWRVWRVKQERSEEYEKDDNFSGSPAGHLGFRGRSDGGQSGG
jgi:hypothetical protein